MPTSFAAVKDELFSVEKSAITRISANKTRTDVYLWKKLFVTRVIRGLIHFSYYAIFAFRNKTQRLALETKPNVIA